jgi:hypothetical protein
MKPPETQVRLDFPDEVFAHISAMASAEGYTVVGMLYVLIREALSNRARTNDKLTPEDVRKLDDIYRRIFADPTSKK